MCIKDMTCLAETELLLSVPERSRIDPPFSRVSAVRTGVTLTLFDAKTCKYCEFFAEKSSILFMSYFKPFPVLMGKKVMFLLNS